MAHPKEANEDKSFRRLFRSFSHMPRTMALVWKSSKVGMSFLGIITLISAIVPLAIAYAGKKIVDAVVAGSTEETLRWVLFELGLVATQALIQRGLGLCRSLIGARLGLDINVKILEKAQALELSHFEDEEFYNKLTRARREASSRPISMITKSFQLIQNTLTLIGYAALLIGFSGWAVLGLLLAAVPATVMQMRFSNIAFRIRNWRSPESRRQMYLESVLANERYTKEVKLFHMGPMLLERYRTRGESFYQEDKNLAIRQTTWAYLLSLLATGAFYTAYAFMALAAAVGRLTLGNMTLYVVSFRQGQQAFQSILTAIGGMYEDNLYMSNLFQYLSIPLLTQNQTKQDKIEQIETKTETEGIRFEKVGFQYPGQKKWALRNIDLHIPQGESLALVGHNGAGKTTFIKLLTGLYQPTEGKILIDGVDISHWDQEELHKRFAVVFQDFNTYQFLARENIALGSVEHLDDEERIKRATKRGGAEKVIESLPDKLNTQLGRWFRDGVELSGGQWQKIALARAFMREEADILILDEPTAALDAEAEQAIFERFRNLAKGRTAILISHRFPTVRMADRILVIEGGEVLEEGTHQELTAQGGRYAQLFSLQAKGYL